MGRPKLPLPAERGEGRGEGPVASPRAPLLTSPRFAGGGILLLAVAAFAQDDKARAAREELERELAALTAPVPTRVRIEYAEVADANYLLLEAEFQLDGRPLKAPPVEVLREVIGTRLVWEGDVAPGEHEVTVSLRYKHTANPVFASDGGREWKLAGTRRFELQRGLGVLVQVETHLDGRAPVDKRLKLSLPATPTMLAPIDTSTPASPEQKRQKK